MSIHRLGARPWHMFPTCEKSDLCQMQSGAISLMSQKLRKTTHFNSLIFTAQLCADADSCSLFFKATTSNRARSSIRTLLSFSGFTALRRRCDYEEKKMRFLVQKWSLNKLCRADAAAAACILRYDATKLQLPSITLRLIQARISALKMMPTHNCCCCVVRYPMHISFVCQHSAGIAFVALMRYGIQLLSWLFLELRREKRRRKQEKKSQNLDRKTSKNQ